MLAYSRGPHTLQRNTIMLEFSLTDSHGGETSLEPLVAGDAWTVFTTFRGVW